MRPRRWRSESVRRPGAPRRPRKPAWKRAPPCPPPTPVLPIAAEHLQNIDALARGIAREFVRPPICVLHRACVIPRSELYRERIAIASRRRDDSGPRDSSLEPCRAPIRDRRRARDGGGGI